MHWAKTRPKVKYDLALSGVLNLPFADLEAKLSDLELHGDNAYVVVAKDFIDSSSEAVEQQYAGSSQQDK